MTLCASSDKILILNGVEDYLQVILAQQKKLIWHWHIQHIKGSMPLLGPHLEYLLDTLNLKIKELKGVVLLRGPGSFTGLRIIFAHIYGLSLGAKVPLAGVDYFSILAKSVPFSQKKWVITHSRHKEVYAQAFEANNKPLTSPNTYSLEKLKKILTQEDKSILLLGSGLRKNPEITSWGFNLLPPKYDHPCPYELIKASYEQHFSLKEFPLPLYLRKSQAEENLAHIASTRGVSLKEAKKILGKPPKISLS